MTSDGARGDPPAGGLDVRLHLGAHRTGTTRVQAELARRQEHLQTRGIYARGPRELRPPRNDALYVRTMLGPAGKLVRVPSARRMAEVRAEAIAADCHSLVLSEEDYAGAINLMLASGTLYPRLVARMAPFAEVLADDRVTVLFAVRSYAGIFASLYAHRTRRRQMPPFERLARRVVRLRRRWPRVLSDLARALPGAEIVVWPFEEMPGRGLAMMRLVIGRDDIVAVGEHLPRDLPAPSAPAIAALNALRSRDREERRALVDATPGPPFRPWTDADRAALDAAYAEDLERLRTAPPPRVTLRSLDTA